MKAEEDRLQKTEDRRRRERGITKNNFYTLYDMAMLGITNFSKVLVGATTDGNLDAAPRFVPIVVPLSTAGAAVLPPRLASVPPPATAPVTAPASTAASDAGIAAEVVAAP